MQRFLKIVVLYIVLLVGFYPVSTVGMPPVPSISIEGKVAAYEYWFDNDVTTKQQITLATPQNLPADLSTWFTVPTTFKEGIHIVTIKFKNTGGVWSAAYPIYITHTGAIYNNAVQSIDAYEYWVDADTTTHQRLNRKFVAVSPQQQLNLNKELEVKNLSLGLHTLHIRFRNKYSKKWSGVFSSKVANKGNASTEIQKITAIQYWYDKNFTDNKIKTFTATDILDVTELFEVPKLPIGLHTVNMRFRDKRNTWSAVFTQEINVPYKSFDPAAKKIDAYEYWYDKDLTKKELVELTTPVETLDLNTQLKAENLTLGVHQFNIRFRDNRAQTWGAVYSTKVINRGNASTEPQKITAVQYWYDKDFVHNKVKTFAPTDTLKMDELFDVPNLSIGMHTVNMRFKDERNAWGSVFTKEINVPYKTFDPSPKKIDAYEYWYDKDLTHKELVKLDVPVETLDLNTQLKAENLSLGLHKFNIRFRDNRAKTWGSVYTTSVVNKGNASTEQQKIIAVQYWYDKDFAGNKVKTFAPTDTLKMDELLEVPELSIGLHTVNMRFKDERNAWSGVFTQEINVPYKSFDPSPKKIDAYEYWYDKNLTDKELVELDTPVETLDLDTELKAENLTLGLHKLNIRFRDNRAKTWGSVYTTKILNKGNASTENQKIIAVQYWYDKDFAGNKIKTFAPTDTLKMDELFEVPELSIGLHTVNMRFKDERNAWTSVFTQEINMPYKPFDPKPKKIDAYEYWYDKDLANKEKVILGSPVEVFDMHEELKADNLQLGLHTLNIRFRDDRAKTWGSVFSEKVVNLGKTNDDFIKGIPQDIVAYQYWLDKDFAKAKLVNITPAAVFNMDEVLEIQNAISGTHTFNIRFKDKRGAWCSVYSISIQNRETQYEVSHESKIDKYCFWVDNNFANRQMITVNPPQKLADIDNSDLLSASNLPVGPHFIHHRFRDTRKAWNSVLTSISLIANPIPAVDPKCGTEEITFSNDLTGTTADKIVWDFGDGSSDHPTNIKGNISIVKHRFPLLEETKTYTVTATITNTTLNATGKAIQEYTVYGVPTAQISSNKQSSCGADEFVFTASGGDEYEFYLGTDTSGTVLQAKSTNNILTYIVTPGDQITVRVFRGHCSSTATTHIDVNPIPKPKLFYIRKN